jgi:hypothetical protein
MPPVLLLLLLGVLTFVAYYASVWIRQVRSNRLAALAATWEMNFTPIDRFQLTGHVAARFPTPGAADIVVRDLVYGPHTVAGSLRYLFTVEYTLGILRTKRRWISAGTLVEQTGGGGDKRFSTVSLAPTNLPLIEQYEWLRAHQAQQGQA